MDPDTCHKPLSPKIFTLQFMTVVSGAGSAWAFSFPALGTGCPLAHSAGPSCLQPWAVMGSWCLSPYPNHQQGEELDLQQIGSLLWPFWMWVFSVIIFPLSCFEYFYFLPCFVHRFIKNHQWVFHIHYSVYNMPTHWLFPLNFPFLSWPVNMWVNALYFCWYSTS